MINNEKINYTHIYVLNKFEKSMLLKSQILNMLEMEDDPLVIFIKNKKTTNAEIDNIMKDYSINYEITDSYFNVFNIMRKIKKTSLLHTREYKTLLFYTLLKWKKNFYFLYDVRGINNEEITYSSNSKINKFKAFIKDKLISYGVRRIDSLSYVTNNMKKVMNNRFPNSTKKEQIVVPTCVRSEDIYSNTSVTENYKKDPNIKLLYTGNTKSSWQNFDEVLSFMKDMKLMYDNITCFLCVDDVKSVNKKIDEIGLSANVMNLPNKEVIELLKITDYGIIFRDDNMVNYVAAPTKLTEYITTQNRIIYTGEIGSLEDLKLIDNKFTSNNFIQPEDIISGKVKLETANPEKIYKSEIISYFLWENNVKKYNKLMLRLTK